MKTMNTQPQSSAAADVLKHVTDAVAARFPADSCDSITTPGTAHIRGLLRHLCSNDNKLAEQVMRWLAYPLCNPGAKMDSALWVHHAQGAGASLLFNKVIAPMYGDYARTLSTGLYSRLNGWAKDALLVLVDDHMSEPHQHARIKQLITSDTICINQKARPSITVPNHMNIVFLSGSDFLPLDTGDRRFMVLQSESRLEPEFYRAVMREIENGGVAKFRHYLTHQLSMGDIATHARLPRTDGAQQ